PPVPNRSARHQFLLVVSIRRAAAVGSFSPLQRIYADEHEGDRTAAATRRARLDGCSGGSDATVGGGVLLAGGHPRIDLRAGRRPQPPHPPDHVLPCVRDSPGAPDIRGEALVGFPLVALGRRSCTHVGGACLTGMPDSRQACSRPELVNCRGEGTAESSTRSSSASCRCSALSASTRAR